MQLETNCVARSISSFSIDSIFEPKSMELTLLYNRLGNSQTQTESVAINHLNEQWLGGLG